MKLKTGDIIILCLISLIDGRAGAKIIYKLIGQYIKDRKKFADSSRISDSAFKSAMSRLKTSGLIENRKRGFWEITKKGKVLGQELKRKVVYENFKNNNKKRKFDTVIVFDIPESYRKKRDYFRIELLSLGFEPLQKSVWIGWKPLPKEFMDYIKDMELLKFLHIFTIGNYGTLEK